MPITGIHHYNLRASQGLLDELRIFYTSAVGLESGYRPPFKNFGYWLYAATEAVLHLSEAAEHESRQRDVKGTFDHVAFSCTGLAGFEARLQEHGIPYTRGEVPLTETIQLFFSDPAGNGVELNFAQGDA